MNQESQWRIDIARKIAPIYAAIPAVKAVVLIGGVARGRGDRYSDIDIATFWDRAPTEAERRAAVDQFEAALGAPVTIGDFAAIPVFDSSDSGILWEEFAFIGVDNPHPQPLSLMARGEIQNPPNPKIPQETDAGLKKFINQHLKIDVNHRTMGSMMRILNDVLIHHDTRGHKLEVIYSIRRVLVLHGENVVAEWQMRAAEYPDALARKLVTMHLTQLKADFAPHVYRGDWLMFYQAATAAEYHLVAALLALNRIYEPELKRLRDLCDEMKLKPDNLVDRLDSILRGTPEQAGQAFDTLAEEVFALVEANLAGVDVTAIREKFYVRRASIIIL